MKQEQHVAGKIVFNDHRKRFVPSVPEFLQRVVNTFDVGDAVTLSFTTKKPTRSQSQLRYYWVILGYLAEFVGCKATEMHEIVIRRKFGTKVVVVDGVRELVRRSVSDGAKMRKDEMGELIEFALELAERLDVKVPTPEQAGYLSNY